MDKKCNRWQIAVLREKTLASYWPDTNSLPITWLLITYRSLVSLSLSFSPSFFLFSSLSNSLSLSLYHTLSPSLYHSLSCSLSLSPSRSLFVSHIDSAAVTDEDMRTPGNRTKPWSVQVSFSVLRLFSSRRSSGSDCSSNTDSSPAPLHQRTITGPPAPVPV